LILDRGIWFDLPPLTFFTHAPGIIRHDILLKRFTPRTTFETTITNPRLRLSSSSATLSVLADAQFSQCGIQHDPRSDEVIDGVTNDPLRTSRSFVAVQLLSGTFDLLTGRLDQAADSSSRFSSGGDRFFGC